MALRTTRLLWLVGIAFSLLALHIILQRTWTPYRALAPGYRDLNPLAARRANATFLMLARNKDVAGVMQSMHQVEARFNGRFGYPWVLLNDQPFTDEFKRLVSAQTDAPIEFGLIPPEHWLQPPWIDNQKAADARRRMGLAQVPYGSSLSYRNMCRFNSGMFFKHELLQRYRYYWRVEPDVQFFCDIHRDPFLYMEDRNISYGFTMSLREYESTIPTLWETVKEFMKEYPHLIEQDNMMNFLSNTYGNFYNLCHFWSNFEIADMDFWRSEAYTEFFNYLDRAGGFYYERWGDAPVHSIGVGLLLKKEKTHFFDDIGYRHEPLERCPTDEQVWARGRCSCDPKMTFDTWSGSCLSNWRTLWSREEKERAGG